MTLRRNGERTGLLRDSVEEDVCWWLVLALGTEQSLKRWPFLPLRDTTMSYFLSSLERILVENDSSSPLESSVFL
jgi:hypothetical protein